jgi:hypothetical protein
MLCIFYQNKQIERELGLLRERQNKWNEIAIFKHSLHFFNVPDNVLEIAKYFYPHCYWWVHGSSMSLGNYQICILHQVCFHPYLKEKPWSVHFWKSDAGKSMISQIWEPLLWGFYSLPLKDYFSYLEDESNFLFNVGPEEWANSYSPKVKA